MIQALKTIDTSVIGNLARWSHGPFWDMPSFGNDPYFGPARKRVREGTRMLFISGPSRNGNHLLHSMLDGHPEICNLPGEDSFLAAFFQELRKDPRAAVAKLRAQDNVDYILHLTGWGINKWRELWELWKSGRFGTGQWAGTQPMGKGFVTDYQDTVIAVDYPAYYERIEELAPDIRNAPTLMDVFWLYLDAMRQLNPDWTEKTIDYVWVGSGMRAEMNFVFERDQRVTCVAPLRPFETFYYSFAKGRRQTTEVLPEVLQEAWEHWWHKTVDYLLLKQSYPEMVCLVNFNHLIEDSVATANDVCRFLGVVMSDACLVPTTMGRPTKGNSSFPKEEQMRGVFYDTGMKRKLDPKHWPELYLPLWEIVEQVSF